MTVPPKSHPCWHRALTGAEPCFSSLATILVVSRLRECVSGDASQMPQAIDELRRFFATNSFAVEDLFAL